MMTSFFRPGRLFYLFTHVHLAICCYCLKRQTYCLEILVWDMLKLFIILFSRVYFFVLRWTCFIYRHNRWLCHSIFQRLGTWGFTWHAAFYPDSALGGKVSSFIFTVLYFSAISNLSWQHCLSWKPAVSLLCYLCFSPWPHFSSRFLPNEILFNSIRKNL